MNQVMLDLETLDTASNAAILSIGAVVFNPEMPGEGLGREFYQPVLIEDQQEKWGRTVSKETLSWWAGQSEAARFVFNDPTAVPLDKALRLFAKWFGSGMELWGNGADFDNVILGNAYAGCRMDRPWSYSNSRCYRTLKSLDIRLEAGEGSARLGTHHNALDDAKYQARYAVAWLRKIKELA